MIYRFIDVEEKDVDVLVVDKPFLREIDKTSAVDENK